MPSIATWRAYTLLLILSTAQLLDIFSVTAPTIALPAISAATHITHTDAEWIINAYSLTFGAFLLTAGRVSELTGPRRLFVAGFSVVGFCVLGCGFARRGEVIFVVRAVQGIGAAMTIPAALAMITNIFPNPGEQDRALGIFAGFGAMGSVSGLVLGGVISELLSWRWVFWILAMVVLPLAALTFILAPPDHPGAKILRVGNQSHLHARPSLRTMDWLGLFTITAALALLTYALSSGPGQGWSRPGVLAPLIIGILLLPIFLTVEVVLARKLVQDSSPEPTQLGISASLGVQVEMEREDTIQVVDHPSVKEKAPMVPRTRPQPLIPPALWALPEFLPLFFIILSEYLFMNVIIYQESLVFQQVWGTTALGAALRIIPFGITGFITTISIGLVTTHVSPRPILVAGQLLMMGSALLLTFARTPDTYWSLVLPALILAALGVASGFVAANIALLRTPLRATPAQRARLPEDSTALIGAIFNADLQIGSTLGLAIATAITTKVNAGSFAGAAVDASNYAGYRASYYFLLGLTAFETVLAAIALRGGWLISSSAAATIELEARETNAGTAFVGLDKCLQHPYNVKPQPFRVGSESFQIGSEDKFKPHRASIISHHNDSGEVTEVRRSRVLRESRSYDTVETVDVTYVSDAFPPVGYPLRRAGESQVLQDSSTTVHELETVAI